MTPDPLVVLDHDQTAAALADVAALTEALATALVAVADGTASVPPRIAARGPHGLLGAMPGHVPGLGLAAKLITVFPDPGHPGRNAHRGLVAAFDEEDGRLLAVLDAEPLTARRTAATSVLAGRTLARPGLREVTVVGTGTLATAHLALLSGDPDLAVTVAGRDPARVAALAGRFGARAAASIEDGVRGADAVFCCTGAATPVIRHEWLAPGTHVSSVGGSDGPEIDAATIGAAALFAEWPGAAASAPPAGSHELQGVAAERVTLLGDVLAGRHPGRRTAAELTVFKSTGHAALDVAAAAVATRQYRS
jgi:ornithine cyclodeaminase/alanine dehydrogenase-like protein (mu-crystallin family)